MPKPTDDRPRRNGIPTVSKRRWEQGERGGLRSRPQRRTAEVKSHLARNETCELCGPLGVINPPGFSEFVRVWAGHPDETKLDPHHVFGRQHGDADWNLVTVCRRCHEFVQGTRVGRLVCVWILDRADRLRRETVRSVTGRDPIGLICNDLEDGLFSGRCCTIALGLCDKYGV